MLDIDDYIDWLLLDLGFRRYGNQEFNERQGRLLSEVLGLFIPRILVGIAFERFGNLGPVPTTESFCLSPLPEIEVITKSCNKFLQGLKAHVFLDFKSWESYRAGTDLRAATDLPIVRDRLEELRVECGCPVCEKGSAACRRCFHNRFLEPLTFLILDILALSLFNCNSSLRARRTRSRNENTWDLQRLVLHVLQKQVAGEFLPGTTPLLSWTRGLVGHEEFNATEHAIMTSRKGQVIYPAIFESFELRKQGYLQLSALTGTLRFNGLSYNAVLEPVGFAHGESTRQAQDFHTFVREPLFEGLEFSWDITPQDRKELHAQMVLQGSYTVFKQNPTKLFDALTRTLYVENCPHDSDQKLASWNQDCPSIVPWDGVSSTSTSWTIHHVKVIPIAGSGKHRFFSMAALSKSRMVLRGAACLTCCLEVGKKNCIDFLIC